MSATSEFEIRPAKEDAEIQEQIEKLAKAVPLTLPVADSKVTKPGPWRR